MRERLFSYATRLSLCVTIYFVERKQTAAIAAKNKIDSKVLTY